MDGLVIITITNIDSDDRRVYKRKLQLSHHTNFTFGSSPEFTRACRQLVRGYVYAVVSMPAAVLLMAQTQSIIVTYAFVSSVAQSGRYKNQQTTLNMMTVHD